MRVKHKHYFYILLAASMLFGVSCQKIEPDHGIIMDKTLTPYPTGMKSKEVDGLTRHDRFDQVLMRVGDLEVSYGEVVLYMQSTKEEVETLYGREVWNYKLDKEGTTYAQMLKDELKKQMIYTKVVCAQAQSIGISLTEYENMIVY